MRVQLTRRRTRSQDGVAAMMVAVSTVVLIGMLAFVTDFGYAYLNKRELQNGVDAAALAAAKQIAVNASRTQSCADLAATPPTNAAGTPVDLTARNMFRENVPATRANVLSGASGVSVTCGADGLSVTVTAGDKSPTFFGSIFGADGIGLASSATAVVGPGRSAINARPFSVCKQTANDLLSKPIGEAVTYPLDNSGGACGSASGNFGWLNFSGPSSNTELENDLVNGYDGTVINDSTISGNPGFRTSLSDSLDQILGTNITLPVFDTVSGNGSNASYHITGFITVTLCGYKLNSSLNTVAPCTTSGTGSWVKLQYVRYLTIGEYNAACRINDPTCDFGARLVKLAN